VPHGTVARSFPRTCLIATSPSYARFASPGKATPAAIAAPPGVADLPLRWRLDHVLGYNPSVAAP